MDIAILPETDLPGIAYFYATSSDLKYREMVSIGTWSTTTIDSSNAGRSASLAYDSNGKAHISYEDNGNDDLK